MSQYDDFADAFASSEAVEAEFPTTGGAQPAWQMIDVGRYQPQRIRGSCRGRVLG